jgi:hypothetical protein
MIEMFGRLKRQGWERERWRRRRKKNGGPHRDKRRGVQDVGEGERRVRKKRMHA